MFRVRLSLAGWDSRGVVGIVFKSRNCYSVGQLVRIELLGAYDLVPS